MKKENLKQMKRKKKMKIIIKRIKIEKKEVIRMKKKQFLL